MGVDGCSWVVESGGEQGQRTEGSRREDGLRQPGKLSWAGTVYLLAKKRQL